MIIITSLVIAFFVVLLIHSNKKAEVASNSIEKCMLLMIHKLELLYINEPVVGKDSKQDYERFCEIVKRCVEMADKHENINIKLLAYKMKSIYDKFKVQGDQGG